MLVIFLFENIGNLFFRVNSDGG